MFFSLNEFALILGAILPGLTSLSLLLIILPHADIPGAIEMLIDALTIYMVHHKIALVNIAVGVSKQTISMSLEIYDNLKLLPCCFSNFLHSWLRRAIS